MKIFLKLEKLKTTKYYKNAQNIIFIVQKNSKFATKKAIWQIKKKTILLTKLLKQGGGNPQEIYSEQSTPAQDVPAQANRPTTDPTPNQAGESSDVAVPMMLPENVKKEVEGLLPSLGYNDWQSFMVDATNNWFDLKLAEKAAAQAQSNTSTNVESTTTQLTSKSYTGGYASPTPKQKKTNYWKWAFIVIAVMGVLATIYYFFKKNKDSVVAAAKEAAASAAAATAQSAKTAAAAVSNAPKQIAETANMVLSEDQFS